ncbi:MAG: efflux RND transporter periplasmic adaptor subunit [Deltaproteobacteria bacterium]|nr:efflux RND transporter periplasmic adaptor subunit [Deltaproteobacteria bacterium]
MSRAGVNAGQGGGGVRLGLMVGGLAVVVLFVAIGRRFSEANAERAAVVAANAQEAVAHGGPLDVKVIRPSRGTFQAVVRLTGEVAPIRDAALSFKQPGRVSAVAVKVGDVVKPGQLLATLDPIDATAQAATALAMVKAAELDVSIQEENEQRTKKLFDQQAISQTEYRGAVHMLDGAKARLETARAQATAAGVMVANTRLSAPFAGTIVQAPSAPGAVVMPGVPLLRIEDTTSLRLSSTVHPVDADDVKVGATVELEGEKKLQGKVTVVFPSVDAQTRRVPLHAEFVNDPAAPLLAGVFVRANVTAQGESRVLKLPAAALKAGSQDEIWVIREGKAKTVHVVFSTGDEGVLLVRDGLDEKDDVILAAGQSLHEGDAVRGTSISDGRKP